MAEDLIENKSKTLSKVWNFLNVSDFKISSVKNSNKSFYLKKNKKFFLPLAKIFRDSLLFKILIKSNFLKFLMKKIYFKFLFTSKKIIIDNKKLNELRNEFYRDDIKYLINLFPDLNLKRWGF